MVNLKYLKDPYTRLKLINGCLSSILYVASSSIIWMQFYKHLDLSSIISINNIWSPLVVALFLMICNKFREQIIKKVMLLSVIYISAALAIDVALFTVNSYSIYNYVIQMATDVTILNLYCYAFNGFESKVFFKADSAQKYYQWCGPITVVAGFIGGCIGYIISSMPLRFLVGIQIVYDMIWFYIQVNIIRIGQKKIHSGELL